VRAVAKLTTHPDILILVTMTLISLAIVGKNNEPLFLKEFRDESSTQDIAEAELFGLTLSSGMGTDGFSSKAKECSLRQQFILHAALDRFDELAGPPPGYGWRESGASGTDAMWVGLLCPVEEMRVYGYTTTTRLKLLAVVDDTTSTRRVESQIMEDEVKQLLIKIHELLVEYTLNPFNNIGDHKISSTRFDKGVSDCVGLFNRTV
jgi:hypothetical protein